MSTTIRKWLAEHTQDTVAKVSINVPEASLDREVTTHLCQRTYCGGEAIIRFAPVEAWPHRSWPMYLVRDDSDGQAWDARWRANTLDPHEPRPWPMLRIVQSG